MALRWLLGSLAAGLFFLSAEAKIHGSSTEARGLHHLSKRADDGPRAVNISVPVDHFHNDTLYEPHSDEKFPLRCWFDAQYYKEGGPVIILASGETSGEDRLPFIEHGILKMLAEATNGIGVILEHRYYGTSFPVPDLKTKNLRFLSTEQALADTAYFAENVKFPGLEDRNLTAASTPYIIYGGSYAGAFAATTQKLTQIVDKILLGKNKEEKKKLKIAFGLQELQDDDFAMAISRGIGGLQSNNWDPEEDAPDFGIYCGSVSSDSLLYASTRHLIPTVQKWVSGCGYQAEAKSLTIRFLNYIGYIRSAVNTDLQGGCQDKTVNECYSIRGSINETGLNQGMMRSWTYQTCTQWGYFQTGSGTPKDQLPLVSRLIDLEYNTIPCREAFNITTPPNVDSINKLGGLNFSFPRVAFIDGEADPWRAATPHRIGLPERESTVSEPFILIEHGVHHWDENGLDPKSEAFDLPPPAVAKAQKEIVDFTKAWLEEWTAEKKAGNDL
ncbi:hypothetical protein CEP52_004853 [Fusarium oligoseptatum]|uniref:Extracelular serine carboxypeptidase n=1 Tax=Fusarium oligoseptatum TaxID=2604345 RepID=A0A428U1F9_9HYPO|nr:hypothetical protein CEP52_004853 [Fusarium oligoseptatum]